MRLLGLLFNQTLANSSQDLRVFKKNRDPGCIAKIIFQANHLYAIRYQHATLKGNLGNNLHIVR